MPLVSVIIPNYNHAHFLKQRIDSVINQSFEDYEVIILDDSSTDNSIEVIETYRSNPNVKAIIYNQINSGSTFKQWDKGLELATGKYIWLAESDDYASIDFLKNAVFVLNKHKNVGVFQAKSHWINPDGKIIFSEPLTDKPQIFKGKNYILNYLLKGNIINNASAILFRKEFVNTPLDQRITSLTYCGDYLFWVQILAKSDLYNANYYQNFFRRHENNISGKAEKNGLDFLEGLYVYKYIRKMYPVKFINPINKSDLFWASTLQFSKLDEQIKKQVLNLTISINPMINFLYRYYTLRRKKNRI